jgi:ppGpp synthetase/RelA/SpoT-type nucleotidyltranferase
VGVVDDFVSEYERQFDFWEASARTARGLLETELDSSGLRAIVTSRAKSVDRLAVKLHGRDRLSRYKNVGDIGLDIADLAGVRVALYFPGQMDEAEQIIRSTLNVQQEKRFPAEAHRVDVMTKMSDQPVTGDASSPASTERGHLPRFSGYGARHFRVLIPDSRLRAGEERYSSALVEVQVASVLMHAWSEVEHDLVYKPLEGQLSSSEYALLDQLNGLVLAGEIALEQLQLAGDARVTATRMPFRNHYELAEFLRTRFASQGVDITDATLGRVDVLFDYLADQAAATASSVEPYLDQLGRDFEHRPVAAQLADLMLSGDTARYGAYLRAMAVSRHPSNRQRSTFASLQSDTLEKSALGEYVATWAVFETLLNDLFTSDGTRLQSLAALVRQLNERGLINPEQLKRLNMMRELRNQVLHGRAGEVSAERLTESAAWLRDLTSALNRKAGQK